MLNCKKTIIIILFSLLFISYVYYLIYHCGLIFKWENNEGFRDFINIIGAAIVFIFTITQFIITKRKEQNDFVKIEVSVHSKSIIKTKLWNDVNTKKYISFAFLLITKQSIDRIKATNTSIKTNTSKIKTKKNKIVNTCCSNDFTIELNRINEQLNRTDCINNTNDLITWKDSMLFIDRTSAFIPLPFYYSENIRIGNEEPTFELDIDQFVFRGNINEEEEGYMTNEYKLRPDNYSVRFFVFSSESLHYHRSTQCILKIN